MIALLLLACGRSPEIPSTCRTVPGTLDIRILCRTETPDAVCYSTADGLVCWPKPFEDDSPIEVTP